MGPLYQLAPRLALSPRSVPSAVNSGRRPSAGLSARHWWPRIFCPAADEERGGSLEVGPTGAPFKLEGQSAEEKREILTAIFHGCRGTLCISCAFLYFKPF